MKALLAALLLASSSLPAKPKPKAAPLPHLMFKVDPARNGRLPQRLAPPLKQLWRLDTDGEFYSSAALHAGVAYVGNSDHHVYAVSLESGALLWKSSLGERIYGSSPQVEGELLYIACVDGCVYALRLADGSQAAKYCVERQNFWSSSPDILGSPLVAGRRLWFGSDNHSAYALELPSGRELWRHATDGKIHDAAPALQDGRIFFASSDGRLYAFEAESGRLLWKSRRYELLNTTPAVAKGAVYFGSRDGRFRCLDAASGAPRWSFECKKGIMSSPAIDLEAGLAVFGSADNHAYALRLADGALAWKASSQGIFLASPLITGTTVWLGSYDGGLYAFNLADGALLARQPLSGGIFASAAALGDRLVLGDRDGSLFCFQAALLP